MDIDEIRRINIKNLEKVHGIALAKKANMSPTQFYNLRDGAKDSKTGKPRGMRKETAWKIEDAAGVERGYLDVLHGKQKTEKQSLALTIQEKYLIKLFRLLPDEDARAAEIKILEIRTNQKDKSKKSRRNPSTSPPRKKAA